MKETKKKTKWNEMGRMGRMGQILGSEVSL